MRVALGTLCLNEMEWLPLLYEQHKDWPGLVRWVFVESADETYAQTNPDRVSKFGLSVDGTTEYLQELSKRDTRIVHVKHGFCRGPVERGYRNIEQAKCEARQRYLDAIEYLSPSVEYLVVLDADEFYCRSHQHSIGEVLTAAPNARTYLFPQRHLWLPPSVRGEPITSEAVGGYWSVPHYRVWRWRRGLRYRGNHNWVEDSTGRYLTRKAFRAEQPLGVTAQRLAAGGIDLPYCIHMGFASSLVSRAAKHRYYVARGEGVSDRRQMYVDCRTAYENWSPTRPELPHGAVVIPYRGPVPEVLSERISSTHELLPTPKHAGSNPVVEGAEPTPLPTRRRR